MHEKRQHPRIPIQLDVSCESADGSVVTGSASDISLGGAFIEAEEAPAFGSKVTIVTRLPGLEPAARLPGIVRWSKPGGFGVQFGLLGARETHAITELMKQSQ